MYQWFKLVILFLCTIVSTTAVFGANAARSDSNNQAHMVPIESRQQPLTESGAETTSAIGGKSDASPTALGYFLQSGISPGIQIGITRYDLQHNSRMARQVAVGVDGRVHFVWTYSWNGAVPPPITSIVYYRSYKDGILDDGFYDFKGILDNRFCTVDVFQNRGLVVYHYGLGPYITSALDESSGGNLFTAIDPPSIVSNCEYITTRGAEVSQFYIWPVVAADQDGSGHLLIHIAGSERRTSVGYNAIVYFRGVSSDTNMEAGMYGPCGHFIDSSTTIGYDIAASPYSNDVVIAYPKARQANRENNDLAYRLSTDLGLTWGPVVNVTDFATGDKERCAGDMSVLFTADNCFHILYVGNIYDSVANTVSDQEARLYHWSSCNPSQRSLVLDANNYDNACRTPAFEYNVCKVNLTQCHSAPLAKDLLYAVYSRQLGTTADPDCSAGGYFNQDVFVSASSTGGETWGAPINLTNTKTNGCTEGACADDGSSTSARYVTDTLRIEYLEDLDAGSFAGNERSTADKENPVKFLSYPCLDMEPYQILTCAPNAIRYPFHAVRNATATQDLVLTNGGNQSISWTAGVMGNANISLPTSGMVPAGYTNSATVTVTAGPWNTEGLYQGSITFSYDSPSKILIVNVDFYVFDVWFLPQDVAIHTASNRMVMNQVGQAADNSPGGSFTYFAHKTEDFIKDASLIMGNSAQNLSWRIFESNQGAPVPRLYSRDQGDPTPGNNFGWLYALSNTDADSTGTTSPQTVWPDNGYRIAWGQGTNRDSTVGFDVTWYAPKHLDTADFYVGHFEVYKGTKNPSGTVTGLDIAFGCDWDVPSDTGSDNTVGIDPARQMIFLRGEYSAGRQRGYAASAAYREDGEAITGGFAWGNRQQVYPNRGYHIDSMWKYMEAIAAPPNNYNSAWSTGDSLQDMNVVLVVARNYTVTSSSRLKFDVVLAAKRAEVNPAGLAGLNTAVDQAKNFICKYVAPDSLLCQASCTSCGDANGNGAINISDAVFLIAYIFVLGSTAPGDCGYAFGMGDANGNGAVNISDAVYLIAYIFSQGPAPHCQ